MALSKLLVAVSQMEKQFKVSGIRQERFKKQQMKNCWRIDKAQSRLDKPVNIELECPAPVRRKPPPGSAGSGGDGTLCPQQPEMRAHGMAARSVSAPVLPPGYIEKTSTGSQSPESPLGISRGRLAAGIPISKHPVPHPGAMSCSQPETFDWAAPVERLPSPNDTSAPQDHALHGMPRKSFVSSPSNAGSPRRSLCARRMTPAPSSFPAPPWSSEDALTTTTAKDAMASLKRHWHLPAQNDESQDVSSLFEKAGIPGDSEEDLLFEALDACDEDACSGSQMQHAETPRTIQRLGDLMVLLGPRYKNAPRAARWKQARRSPVRPESPSEDICGKQEGSNAQLPPLALVTPTNSPRAPNSEGEARKNWLRTRSGAKEMEASRRHRLPAALSTGQ